MLSLFKKKGFISYEEGIGVLNHLYLQLLSIWFQPFLNCGCHINLNNTEIRTFINKFSHTTANVEASSHDFFRKISKTMDSYLEIQFCILKTTSIDVVFYVEFC